MFQASPKVTPPPGLPHYAPCLFLACRTPVIVRHIHDPTTYTDML